MGMILNIRLELRECECNCRYTFCPLRFNDTVKIIELAGIQCKKIENMLIELLDLRDEQDIKELKEFLRGNLRAVGWFAKFIERIKKTAKREEVQPPSWGQEIEISDEAISTMFIDISREVLGGGYDGSGPWEFSLGPFRISEFPFEFFEIVIKKRLFDWRDYENEMGCHIHYRPDTPRKAIYWAYGYINCYTLSIILSKLLCHFDYGREWMFRARLIDWAPITRYQYRVAKNYIEDKDSEWEELIDEYEGREYSIVTLNRNRKTTLTIEMRMAECHTINAWAFLQVVNYFTMRKELPFTVRDFDRLARYYENLSYEKERLDREISLEEIGIDSSIVDPKKKLTFRRIAMMILDRVKIDSVARKLVEYIYSGNAVTNNYTYRLFIEKALER